MAKWALLAVILVSGCGGDDGDCGDAAVAGDSVATGVVCEGDFAISNSVELEALANCKEVTGNLGIVDNDALTSISLPALASVGGRLLFRDNAALCQSIADELVARVDVQGEVIAGHLDVTGNRDGC